VIFHAVGARRWRRLGPLPEARSRALQRATLPRLFANISLAFPLVTATAKMPWQSRRQTSMRGQLKPALRCDSPVSSLRPALERPAPRKPCAEMMRFWQADQPRPETVGERPKPNCRGSRRAHVVSPALNAPGASSRARGFLEFHRRWGEPSAVGCRSALRKLGPRLEL
jgi:hypothetical protein